MRKYAAYIVVIGFSLALTACSSGEKREGEPTGDELPLAEAGTDAVPAPSAEQQVAQAPAGDPAAAASADALQGGAVDPAANAMAAPVGGSGEFQDYPVNSGDTLMKIAFEVYGDLYQWRRIYETNKDKVSDPNRLAKGMVLKVEKPGSPVQIDRNGEQYLIKNGDTLGSISGDLYGTRSKWKKLWENNRQLIKDPNKIFAGFTLYYTMTPEEQQTRGAAPLADGAAPQAAPRNPSSVNVPATGTVPPVGK